MRTTAIWCTTLALMACGDTPPPGLNPSGDTIRVTCTADKGITYDYGCGTDDPTDCSRREGICFPDQDGTASSSWTMCRTLGAGELKLDPGTFHAALASECEKTCTSTVDDEACDIVRYAENIDGCDDLSADYELEDCSVTASLKQQLELNYTSLTGATLGGIGTLSYTLDTPGRAGRTGTLWSVELDSTLAFATTPRDLSSWMGFAEGTTISVRSARLTHPVPFTLDSRNQTTLKAETVSLVANVEITEPGKSASRRDLYAELPFTLVVTATDTGLSIAPASDRLGGAFTFQTPRR
jgi:hypothetical protein